MPQAFDQDAMALALSQEAVSIGAHLELKQPHVQFLLLPYMYSESRKIHQIACNLFEQYTSAEVYDFELRHKAIIDQFGRYPHRNAILGRSSTAQELDFLHQPHSSF